MFALLANSSALGINAANSDIANVADPEFSARNNHFIFTEDYDLVAAYYVAASATRLRLNVPSINGIARHHVFPLQRSATIPTLPFLVDYRSYPIELPQDEEIAWEGSNNLGAATEQSTVLSWVAPRQLNQNIPRGIRRLNVRASYTITSVANVWTGPGALTFDENLKGGWYSIVGAEDFDPNVLAFRMIFPKAFMNGNRKMRPGNVAINAAGNTPFPGFHASFGEWGRFHSFEPPQVEILAINAGAHTGDMRLDLVYMGAGGGGYQT